MAQEAVAGSESKQLPVTTSFPVHMYIICMLLLQVSEKFSALLRTSTVMDQQNTISLFQFKIFGGSEPYQKNNVFLKTMPKVSHYMYHADQKLIEWFSFECRKTKTKVINLANHKEHRQYSEPIKIRSNYM